MLEANGIWKADGINRDQTNSLKGTKKAATKVKRLKSYGGKRTTFECTSPKNELSPSDICVANEDKPLTAEVSTNYRNDLCITPSS